MMYVTRKSRGEKLWHFNMDDRNTCHSGTLTFGPEKSPWSVFEIIIAAENFIIISIFRFFFFSFVW